MLTSSDSTSLASVVVVVVVVVLKSDVALTASTFEFIVNAIANTPETNDEKINYSYDLYFLLEDALRVEIRAKR